MRPIGLLSDHVPGEIPASHRDLAECPPVAALTTVTRDGYPQTSVVWCDFDGQCVRVNTMRGFAKERNMRRNRRVTLLCYDPRQPLRYLEVRGMVAEMTEAGAAGHLDCLACLLGNQKVSLLVVDPGNTSRFIQIRGDAELVTKDAREHLDALTRKYTSHPAYYGHLYPEAQRLRETRVICRIHPRRITLDAIHIADH